MEFSETKTGSASQALVPGKTLKGPRPTTHGRCPRQDIKTLQPIPRGLESMILQAGSRANDPPNRTSNQRPFQGLKVNPSMTVFDAGLGSTREGARRRQESVCSHSKSTTHSNRYDREADQKRWTAERYQRKQRKPKEVGTSDIRHRQRRLYQATTSFNGTSADIDQARRSRNGRGYRSSQGGNQLRRGGASP